MALHSSKPGPSGFRKQKYNTSYDAEEASVSYMLNKELDIDSDDEMDLEIEGETVSEGSNNEMLESENESETSVMHVDGWEDMAMGDKKPKAYTFSKNAGPQFNLLPDAEPMDHFILFFTDELVNNIVIETESCARHKIVELQLSPGSS
jgi:hypothetical protein